MISASENKLTIFSTYFRLFTFSPVIKAKNVLNHIANIEKIVSQAVNGNRMALREIYNRFHPAMLGLCVRMTGNKSTAEDILQEAFIKAFSRLKQLKEPQKLAGWLKRIVLNECMDYIKHIRHFDSVEEVELIEENDQNDWFKSVSFDQINEEIDLLPLGCKQVLTLYLIEGFKHKEIAEMMGLSVSTAKSQYQYALKILKVKLKEKMIWNLSNSI